MKRGMKMELNDAVYIVNSGMVYSELTEHCESLAERQNEEKRLLAYASQTVTPLLCQIDQWKRFSELNPDVEKQILIIVNNHHGSFIYSGTAKTRESGTFYIEVNHCQNFDSYDLSLWDCYWRYI